MKFPFSRCPRCNHHYWFGKKFACKCGLSQYIHCYYDQKSFKFFTNKYIVYVVPGAPKTIIQCQSNYCRIEYLPMCVKPDASQEDIEKLLVLL